MGSFQDEACVLLAIAPVKRLTHREIAPSLLARPVARALMTKCMIDCARGQLCRMRIARLTCRALRILHVSASLLPYSCVIRHISAGLLRSRLLLLVL